MQNNEFRKVRIKNRTCYYLDDIIKSEDFDFDNILIDKNLMKVFWLITFRTEFWSLTGPKPLRIRFDKIDGFIRVYDGTRY